MLAIGIDPGTAICGFGLVEMVGNKLTPIHYGAVFTDKDMLPELRLKKIYDELSVLLDEYRPDVMSVEQLFFNRNVTTAISVGQARGVALLTAANRGIQITEFTPMQIKQAVVGYGGANKEHLFVLPPDYDRKQAGLGEPACRTIYSSSSSGRSAFV